MSEVQTVSIAIASASVTLAAFYYALQIRHQSKIRQTDLILRLQSEWRSKELRESYRTVMRTRFRDYDEYAKKEIDSPELKCGAHYCFGGRSTPICPSSSL